MTRRDALPEASTRLVVRATTSAEQYKCTPNLRGIGLLPIVELAAWSCPNGRHTNRMICNRRVPSLTHILSGQLALLHACDFIKIFTGNKYNTSRQTLVQAPRAGE